MKNCRVLAAILITGIVTAGCRAELRQEGERTYVADYEAGMYEEDYDVMDKGPVGGGTLNLFTTEPDSLNPILTRNRYVADLLGFVYEGLTCLDSRQRAIPVLSTGWSASPDGLSWNFRIRDGVEWHDGEPFTAYDVEFTINAIMNPAINSVYKPMVYNISACTAVDAANVRIALKKPNSFTAEMMTFPIIPRHRFEHRDILSASREIRPVGTGPYSFGSYAEGKNITLDANTGWWKLKSGDVDNPEGMYIRKISADIRKNEEELSGLFMAGEVDAACIETGDLSRYRGRTDIIIKKFPSRNFEFLSFNLRNPVFADIYSRKAINMAINKDELINDAYDGDAIAADLPVLPGCWLYNGESPGAALENTVPAGAGDAEDAKGAEDPDKAPGARSNELKNGMDIKTPGIAGIPVGTVSYGSVKVNTPAEMLLAGGWKASGNGYYKVIGGTRRYLRVRLAVNSNNGARVRAARKICEQLNAAGIPAEPEPVGWDVLAGMLAASKYDIALLGCRIPQVPDISYLYSDGYLPAPLTDTGPMAYNISGYHNSGFDANLEALFRENESERKKAVFSGLRAQAANDVPYIGMYFLMDAMVYSRNVRGLLKPHAWNRYNDITLWYKPEAP